jgi:phosphatidate cytidylyltransferase
MLYLRTTPQIGMELVLYLLVTVWATDIGAYAVGRLVGGAKFAPTISPNKTWAGVFGGIAAAAIFGTVAAWAFDANSIVTGFVLAIALSVAAQLGDLFESWMKRRADVKHSGNLIPGHGGVLDRIDSLIAAAIVFAFFQALIGVSMEWW